MTGTERALLIRRLADRLAENAEALAAIETMDDGKLLREMRRQLTSLPEWYSYFAGAADKIQGETIPSDKPNFFVYTRREPWHWPFLMKTEQFIEPSSHRDGG
jgi:acyl-CoA reductase-like NAD-dependent aldehyde dehydrogenase